MKRLAVGGPLNGQVIGMWPDSAYRPGTCEVGGRTLPVLYAVGQPMGMRVILSALVRAVGL